ncbi:CDP-alcohol phosphatidyltransferase family protein [Flavobacterium sedimenticola]|uniref:CDP-alcohol phosphatidyltransferase family protein n=1 Tax=Flavobacterium sedimenticola TaxID=3043286 RepID=A0ABT6XRD4_9FLAO|nr:CDP-alcohol phosphatidyltransferase family protein [Flavobacterium sedimenticola]MDI9257653.1 CDP-alcohol phosphatidyltransferase family protein [Flavobacterium sedimenticola]
MNIKAWIPNFFTMLNLLCGCVALVFVSEYSFYWAFSLVCLGIFFDFFDGFFARKFNVAGPLGVQLDSLADMITSGVVPGFVMYKMLVLAESNTRFNPSLNNIETLQHQIYVWPLLGFLITVGACYRLAKFNIDTRQTDSFIGLPTPANALFVVSLPLLWNTVECPYQVVNLLMNKWFLLSVTVVSAFVMNAEIPLFSLKIKEFSFAKYKLQISFLAISVLLLIFLKILAVPLIIVVYVLLSVFNNMTHKKASV